MKIVIAPNAFKGSLSATDVADALKEGILETGFDGEIISCPVGDGGDGTGVLLRNYLHATTIHTSVTDPLGRVILAPWGWVAHTHTAIIEMSDASGLKLLNPAVYSPLSATTDGCGQLIKAGLEKGAKHIVLCIGGSATIDGGSGILRALGADFKNRNGEVLSHLPADLLQLAAIDLVKFDQRIYHTNITILCDVKTKLLGKAGTAAVFGPQKGASADDIELLDKGLAQFDLITEKHTGKQMRNIVSGGAAGGVGAALQVYCTADLMPGIDYLLNLVQFKQLIADADWVITGEGAIDEQTLQGKAPFGVAKIAKECNVPVLGIAGNIITGGDVLFPLFDRLICINPEGIPITEAMKKTKQYLIGAGKKIMQLLNGQS